MRKGKVYMNGFLAGTISEETGVGYTFIYDEDYFENPSRPAISLTMPKKQQIYRSPHLFPFFANMLSEGSNRAVQAKLHRVDIRDDFGILLATASVDAPGAITVKRVDND
jgi:serine/threonine-protein kinase HipA